MGGSNTNYGQTGGQGEDAMSALPKMQNASANQPNMFGKMDKWQVESAHPEQVAAAVESAVNQLAGAYTGGMTSKKGNSTPSSKGSSKGSSRASSTGSEQVMLDEFGYPYTLDANGQPVYDIGSVQVMN